MEAERPRVNEEGELTLVFEAAQAAISQEFQISERLDAKIRTEIGSAAAWFAVGIGIAGTILSRATPVSDTYTYLVVSIGFAALGLFIVTGYYAFGVWRLRDEDEIAPSALFEMTASARDPDDDFGTRLVSHYADILASRRRNNQTRARAFRKSTPWYAATLSATLAQLVAALCAAAFSS